MKLTYAFPLIALFTIPLMASQGHVYRDGDGSISVYRLEPNAQIRVGIDTPPSRTLTSNPCGLLVINASDSYPLATVQVDGALINPATLLTQIRPNCRPRANGSYALDEERSQHFVTEAGDLVIVGKTPDTRYNVSYPGQLRILTRRVNSCGFLRVRETETINFNQSILLPTTSASTYAEFQIDQIPQTIPLLCYRNHLYYPQPWTDIFATAIEGSDVSAAQVDSAQLISSAFSLSRQEGMTGDESSGGSGTSVSQGGGNSGSSGTTETGTGGTGSGTTGSGSDGETGDSEGGSDDPGDETPASGIHDFTAASYDPRIHDYNNDNQVDDTTGDGIPDDRDGDGHPDGPWRPGDIPNSAGPGLTIPVKANVCLGFNGNVVASSYSFIRSYPYFLTADDGLSGAASEDPLPGSASSGALSGPPVIRFEGDFRSSNFSHIFEGSPRYGYILRDEGDDFHQLFQFKFNRLPSCLVPPWLTNFSS
jgi:hypothetical protein